MKKVLILTVTLLFVGGMLFFSRDQNVGSAEEKIGQALVAQVLSFQNACDSLKIMLENNSNEQRLQRCFLRARLAYKTFEWAAEYFEPTTTRFVNGPPVPEVEESGQTFEPAGLQVMEGLLFPHYDTAKFSDLAKQIEALRSRCKTYQLHFEKVQIFNWQIFDAVKLEVFRVEATGMAGFDNPLSLRSSEESSTALKSLRDVLSHYSGNQQRDLPNKFNNAVGYLASHTDFNSFDRARFILDYCNGLTIGITDLEDGLKFSPLKYNRLLNQGAKTLFDTNAFNVNAYSPDISSFVTPEKIILGRKLFFDSNLSGNGMRSCASCHQPLKAFTDGLVKNKVIGSDEMLSRNTPTLINAAMQAGQFYDMRVNTLENQSHDVVQSALEMHGSILGSVEKLWKDKEYKALFNDAFPKKNRMAIDTLEVMNAIASYVRSLTLLSSRFDEYMRGNKNAINADEKDGFNLFMGKAKCATCHYMPLFNGSFPPRYMKTEVEVIGVPATIAQNSLDADLGRYNIVNAPALKHAFKIPTLRNVALTAPYMHNGVFTNLGQVIEFYDKGGGAGLGLPVENQTLPTDKLKLTEKEKADLVAFFKDPE